MTDRLRIAIAIPLFPRFTALDAIGPYEVLQRIPTFDFLPRRNEPTGLGQSARVRAGSATVEISVTRSASKRQAQNARPGFPLACPLSPPCGNRQQPLVSPTARGNRCISKLPQLHSTDLTICVPVSPLTGLN